MIAMEDWVTIKTLKAKNPEMSLREIAELLGISHHTVKAALAHDEAPSYKRTAPVNPLLDPFREVIAEMVNVKHFRGSRILEEIKSKGYSGGRTALYHLLHQLKVESARCFTPYETAPGEHYGKTEIMLRYTLIALVLRKNPIWMLHIISLQRLQPFEQIRRQGVA